MKSSTSADDCKPLHIADAHWKLGLTPSRTVFYNFEHRGAGPYFTWVTSV